MTDTRKAAGGPKLPRPVDMSVRRDDGRHLALTAAKLAGRFGGPPARPFVIYALGSSYTNSLGDGAVLARLIKDRFPDAQIVYKKHVGSSATYLNTVGWVRHFAAAENPDLFLIYASDDPDGLDAVLTEIRTRTTADILVPSLHLRWGDSADEGRTFMPGAVEADPWPANRKVARRHGVEWVENRREWADYLKANGLTVMDLMSDHVHQSPAGARLINHHIARHVADHPRPAYEPTDRERRLMVADSGTRGKAGEGVEVRGEWKRVALAGGETGFEARGQGARMAVRFRGDRIHLIGARRRGGGVAHVFIDGRPAERAPTFHATFVTPDDANHGWHQKKDPECAAPSSLTFRRDRSPHAIELGDDPVPQTWMIVMTTDAHDYEIVGSIAGPDGTGNYDRDFVSRSGQIRIPAAHWRKPNHGVARKGDKWTFEVRRPVVSEVDFGGRAGLFRLALADDLPNTNHSLELVAEGDGPVAVSAFEVFEPPLGRE